MDDLTPQQIEALAQSIARHAAGETYGTGHLTDFPDVKSQADLVGRIKDMINDPETKFLVNASEGKPNSGSVYLYNEKTRSVLVFNPNQLQDPQFDSAGRVINNANGVKADNFAGTFYSTTREDKEGTLFSKKSNRPVTEAKADRAFRDQIKSHQNSIADDMGLPRADVRAQAPQKISENSDWADRIRQYDSEISDGLRRGVERIEAGEYATHEADRIRAEAPDETPSNKNNNDTPETRTEPAEVVADQDSQRNPAPVDGEGDVDAKPKINGEGEAPDTKPTTNVGGDDVETSRPAVGDDVELDTRTTAPDADLKPPVASLGEAPDLGNGNSDGTVRLVPTETDPDVRRSSPWTDALREVDGGGSRVGTFAQQTAGKAGFGLSAFHLKQQLLGENSTFKQDIQNEEVAGMATTALTLDVGAFALDTVDLTADATRGGLALAKSAGYIDDVANLGRLGSGVSTLSKIGRVAGPIGTAITVVTTGIEYNIAAATDDGKRAGQAVGAGGGALGGAAIGAGIGVWFFGVGAAPGAAIGGIIGAFGGGYAGGETLDDDFQEYFDAKTLEEQRENLGKLEGIGENLDRFQELEQEYTQSLETLQEAYEGTDVAAIEAAQMDFESKRMALSDHVENSLLTQSEIQTLDSVDEFIQKQAQFYAEKEQRLTAAGDTEALQRLADSRQGLEQAAQSIHRLKNLSEMIGEGYGQNQAEAVQKAQEQIASVGAMVDERQESIVQYQAGLKQQEFGQDVSAQLDKVNTAYNDGVTDNALMQRSAALMGLVESGDMNADVLSEANQEITQLAQQHETELAQIKQAQAELLALTRQEQNGGASEFKQGNLEALERYNTQIADLVASYEATGEVLEQATNMAENAVAVSELQNNAITVDTAFVPQLEELQSDFEQALQKDIPDPAEISALQERAEALKQTAEQNLSEASAREAQIKDMLENGIEVDGVRQPVENETTKQQLQEMLEEATELKQQSAQQIETLGQNLSQSTAELDNRVLTQDNFSLTLDSQGYVSSYGVGGNVEEFAQGERPMLVDANAHIFSSVSGIENVPTQLSLYNGDVITKVGESYQENSREDRAQRREIEDRSERRDVKREEKDLSESLEGKTMDDAVRPSDVAPDNRQGSIDNDASTTLVSHHFQQDLLPDNIQPSFNEISIPDASDNELSVSITDDPDYIEAAISLEKILAGEPLDDIEQLRLEEIMNDPDIDPTVIASLSENYGDTAQSFITNNSNTDADVATLAMVEEAHQDQAVINQGTMKI